MKKTDFLRKKYPRFIYDSYSWKISGVKPRGGHATLRGKDLKISFDFRIEPNLKFKPTVIIKNIDKKQIKRVGDRALDNLVFNLGLIELLSYWKATCSPEILIKAGQLNQEQIKWWKDLIDRGMGQFFFENKINFRKPNFIKINSAGNFDDRSKRLPIKSASRGLTSDISEILVPVGGGKDSIVTLEILKHAKSACLADASRNAPMRIACFSLNPTEAAKKIMRVAGCRNPVIVERKIDKKLFELNQKGFLNGHTPFSAYLAFSSVLLAVLFNFKYIAFSNERSSNEGNVKYLERVINHQYSKSFDFERKFRKYCQNYLTPEVNYFSFLRPLYEIQIAKLFSKYPKYFNSFLSCNVAYQTASGTKLPAKRWCGKCPKCLFVFVSLYPFIGQKVIKIFGKNLFEDRQLLPLMLQLIGKEKFKPFECVGTKKESLIAFYLSWKKSLRSGLKSFLLNYFERNVLLKCPNLERESKKILNSWSNQNYLPPHLKSVLFCTIKR